MVAKFTKVKRSKQRMYGPRCLLVCGCPPESQQELFDLLAGIRLSDCTLIFATTAQLDTVLADVLALPDRSGAGMPSDLPPATILSGLTERELHRLMNAWRTRGWPPQMWAALTPTSESWTLRALLAELTAERAAMSAGAGPGRPTGTHKRPS